MNYSNRQPVLNLGRREFLSRAGGGFGSLVLAALLADQARADAPTSPIATPPKPEWNGGLHHKARVKRIIQLFMTGGVSQMDTFDYKPELERLHGQSLGPKEKPEGFTAMPGTMMKSPFAFKQHGQCGRWVSSVLPHMATQVDRLTFLMAMTTKTNVHGPGTYMMNSGFLLPGFPCMGAWISYALGNLTDNLPTFVVLPDARGLPYNQKGPFSAGFLPAVHQGTVIETGAAQAVPDLFAAEKHKFATREADRDGQVEQAEDGGEHRLHGVAGHDERPGGQPVGKRAEQQPPDDLREEPGPEREGAQQRRSGARVHQHGQREDLQGGGADGQGPGGEQGTEGRLREHLAVGGRAVGDCHAVSVPPRSPAHE